MVQRELEARELVDYGTGSLASYPSAMPSYGRRAGDRGPGGSYRQDRDYYGKRRRDDDRTATDGAKGVPDDEARRLERNPRFRERGESEDDEEDDRKRRR